jgi:hypothetical protein
MIGGITLIVIRSRRRSRQPKWAATRGKNAGEAVETANAIE